MRLLSLFLAFFFLLSPLQAQTTVDLSAEAAHPAANDLMRAVVFLEGSGQKPEVLARQINREMGDALEFLRAQRGLTVKTGQQSTYPVYARDQKIEHWRLRSELILESGDASRLSSVLGELQQRRLALAGISHQPSPETRRQAEEAATRAAIAAFEQRAALVAATLNRRWKIRHLAVSQGGGGMPMLRAAPAMMMAEAVPVAVEPGETRLTVTVSGQIELME